MSEIRPQSSTHFNPANSQSAIDAQTRTQISEESGMQMDQHDTQTTTALLRKETSVDTLETNSLCCAAAGIIAPSSSTTEALIPHEKLREAATPNATLNAQNRPPAQPVEGDKAHHWEMSSCASSIDSTASLFSRHSSCLHVINDEHGNATRLPCLNRLNSMKNISDRGTKFEPAYSGFSSGHFIELYFTHQVVTIAQRDLEPSHHAFVARIVSKVATGIKRYISDEIRDDKQLIQKLSLCLLRSFRSPLVLRTGDSNCHDDRKHRPHRLHPCGCVFLCIKSIKQYKKSPPQCTGSQKQPHHPNRGCAHKRWQFQTFHSSRPLAIKRSARLPTFITLVYESHMMEVAA